MHIMTFSERPYFHVSEDDIITKQQLLRAAQFRP